MQLAAAELLGRDDLADGRLDQRWSAEEDRALPADDDRLVAHRRHVGAAGGAGTEDGRDLRNRRRGHPRLVVEDPAEMFAVREDLVLLRQVRAAGIDERDAGDPVLEGDLLGPEVLLHRDREIGAAFDRGVVANHQDVAAVHQADAGDDAGGRHVAA